MSEKIIEKNKGLVKADFGFWVGLYMDKFYDTFEQKKIIGNKCQECGAVFVPPRNICGICNIKLPLDQNWIDVSDEGILINYTRTAYKVTDRRARKAKKLNDIGMVQLEGSDTAIVYPLIDFKEDDLKTGMKVKVKWKDNPTGGPSDIEGFIKG
ncbi:MAG: hypothetical protein BAJALOKI1v1_640012 [Promethearchaeota archaeon]|nr:MAG: hypothetical protein BAJALOKI1v1_640012 [Candidatus Lokiarchaeota archaeon]